MEGSSDVVAEANQTLECLCAQHGTGIPGLKLQAYRTYFGVGYEQPLPVSPLLLVKGIEMNDRAQPGLRSTFSHPQYATAVVTILERR
jgi:hypothetical protein